MHEASPRPSPRRLPHVSAAKLARLRRLFAIVGALSPSLAARILFRQFLKPGRRRQLDAADEASLARARQGRVRVGEETVHVYDWGPPGGPAVLLLHGWGSHGPRWSAFVEALVAQGWRAIAFDAPAHGRSTGDRSSLPAFRAALDVVISRFGPIQALVGHSFGALAIATRLAEAGELTPARAAVLISLPKDAEYLLDLYLDMIEARPAVRERVRALFVKRFGKLPAEFSALAGAARIEAPVLVVHDREDEAVPHEHSIEISALLHRSTLHLTHGLGHNRLLRDAGLVARVTRFLADALPRSSPDVGEFAARSSPRTD